MIDTHAHIYDEAFAKDLNDMLLRAHNTGIQEIWMPNCNSDTIPLMHAVEALNPDIYKPLMGLHPCYVNENYKVELSIIKQNLEARPYIMVGEIGLDYYWDLSYTEAQKEAFILQCKWAKEMNLSVCIHSRSSKDGSLNAIVDCVNLIKNNDLLGLKGVFHCFSGNKNDAEAVLEIGFYLGIGGVVTFKNSGLDTFIGDLPLDKLVLETDSPYLAPVPYRGKRNESSYLDLVAEKLSYCFQTSKDTVIKTTTNNAYNLISNEQ